MRLKILNPDTTSDVGADADGKMFRRGTGGVWHATNEQLAEPPADDELRDVADIEADRAQDEVAADEPELE